MTNNQTRLKTFEQFCSILQLSFQITGCATFGVAFDQMRKLFGY